MNVASVPPATQILWEEVRQDTMRNAPKTVSASGEQEVSVISIDPQSIDADGVTAVIARIKARQKSGKPAAVPAETVSTGLENVGPNTYERIRQNAGKTYLAQAMAFAGEDAEAASAGIYKHT